MLKNKNYLYNRNVVILLIATLGLLPIFITTGGFYPDCDAGYQILPLIIETKRMLSSGLPLWSWDTYMGDNFIGGYMYYTLTSPFALLNCLFPYEYIGIGFIICLYLKLLICGYVADRYFREMGYSEGMRVLGSLLYTFSSWAITNLYYYSFIEPMIVFPLLLIAIERFIKGTKYCCTLLMAATGLVAISNCYFIPCSLLPAAIYFFCRLLCCDYTARCRRVYIAKAIGCVSVGLLASAFVILPMICHLQGSERGAIHLRALWEYMAERFQTLFIPSYVEGPFDFVLLVSSWSSNAAFIAVFGCLPALMLIIRRPKSYISVICLILILIYITPANGVFSLFTNSDYSRWAYALTLFLTSATLYYFKEFHFIRLRYTILYAAFCSMLYLSLACISLYWYAKNGIQNASHTVRIASSGALLAVNLLCLLYTCRQASRGKTWVSKAVVTAILCTTVNMLMFSCTVSPGTPLTSRQIYGVSRLYGLSDKAKIFSQDRVHLIHDCKDATLYNWGLVAGCQAVESFHSLRNPLYEDVVYYAMCPDGHSNFLYAKNQKDEFNALMSVKSICWIDEDGNLMHIPNPNYIPMGYTYDRYRLYEDVIGTERRCEYNDSIFALMLDALLIERSDEAILAHYMTKSIDDTPEPMTKSVNDRRRHTCDTFRPLSDGFIATISLPETKAVFFSVVADDGFTAYVDSEKVEIYKTNLGFSTIVVPSGTHTILFKFMPRGLVWGIILSAISIIIILGTFIYEKRNEKDIASDTCL